MSLRPRIGREWGEGGRLMIRGGAGSGVERYREEYRSTFNDHLEAYDAKHNGCVQA